MQTDDRALVVASQRLQLSALMPALGVVRGHLGDHSQKLLGGIHVAAGERRCCAGHEQVGAGAAQFEEQRKDFFLDRLGFVVGAGFASCPKSASSCGTLCGAAGAAG